MSCSKTNAEIINGYVHLHLIAVFPDVVKFYDVGVFDQLQNSHFALKGYRHPPHAFHFFRCSTVNLVELCQAARLGHFASGLGDDFDGYILMS